MASSADTSSSVSDAAAANGPTLLPPLNLGVFGGSFNPIHLGHILLAITTQQTKPLDKLIMVPVYKHVRKTDLLPFDDRVEMCRLAVKASGAGGNVEISTIERDVGESNAAMLRAVREKYANELKRDVELFWICGDDVFRWIEKPKGIETMAEVAGLIVQRRLHKASAKDNFYKDPLDEDKIRSIGARLNVSISFIYGELPHFSSTLVRNTPGMWRSFLPQAVAKYLEGRPDLLAQLHKNLEADAKAEENTSAMQPTKRQKVTEVEASSPSATDKAAQCILQALDVVHTLQYERGYTGLVLSVGTKAVQDDLCQAQSNTDSAIGNADYGEEWKDTPGLDECSALNSELRQIPSWLKRDRAVVQKKYSTLKDIEGPDGWLSRYALASKYNSRIDCIMGCILRSLKEIESKSSVLKDAPDLISGWFECKEMLGRVRAFVCCGGQKAPSIIKQSLKIRSLFHQFIEAKERRIGRIETLAGSNTSTSHQSYAASDALRRMLEDITGYEWLLLGSFAPSTPVPLMHKLLSTARNRNEEHFDVLKFFSAASAAIDLMLNETKALTAFGCARA